MNALSTLGGFASPVGKSDGSDVADGSVRIAKVLESCLWNAVEDIGGRWDGKRNAVEMKGKAIGIRNTLDFLAERLEIDFPTSQIRAALGERFRRMDAPEQKLANRSLSNLAAKIRDKRIAVIDRHERVDVFGADFKKWESVIRHFDRHGTEDWDGLETVKLELRALRELYLHLLNDGEWFQKHYEAEAKAKAGKTTEAQSHRECQIASPERIA
jgi:hypothetical protein